MQHSLGCENTGFCVLFSPKNTLKGVLHSVCFLGVLRKTKLNKKSLFFFKNKFF
jgi:hypothetical protein